MTFRKPMLCAITCLEAALQAAEQERDRMVFQLARGMRSQQQLIRQAERVALLRGLKRQARELLPPAQPPQDDDSRRAS
jgi:hypothetical protein